MNDVVSCMDSLSLQGSSSGETSSSSSSQCAVAAPVVSSTVAAATAVVDESGNRESVSIHKHGQQQQVAHETVEEEEVVRNDANGIYKRVSLYTVRGALIEQPCEIVHDDVLIVVPEGQQFLPPLPLEQLLLMQNTVPIAQQWQQHQMMNDRHFIAARAKQSKTVSPTSPSFANHISLDRFASELYLEVFSFLDHRDLCLRVSRVCRQWNRYCNDQNLWRELCANVSYYRQKRRMLYKHLENESAADISHVSDDGSSTTAILGIAAASGDSHITQEDAHDAVASEQQQHNHEDQSQYHTDNSSSGSSNSYINSSSNDITPEELRQIILQRGLPPFYRTWKAYYRNYILWSGAAIWDTTEHGPNIKFSNCNRTISRTDEVAYHWQSVKMVTPIVIPTEEQKRRNGIFSGNPDDISIFEFEICIDRLDTSHQNGWWIVIGLETEQFRFRELSPTNLIGYDKHLGFGFAAGNGDALHCYNNQTFRDKQPFTCDPVRPWVNVPYKEGDVVRARVQYCNKIVEDVIDPKEYIGATLEFFVNDRPLGQMFRNITGTMYPAVSLLLNQQITLRNYLGLQ